MMNFLASMLREEGGFEYKKAIVSTIVTIVDENPAARDIGMFIEEVLDGTLPYGAMIDCLV